MSFSPLALQWTELSFGLAVVIALAAILLVPYLIKEIRGGKRELGPLRRLGRDRVTLGPPAPVGAGDNNPGRLGDPADVRKRIRRQHGDRPPASRMRNPTRTVRAPSATPPRSSRESQIATRVLFR